MKWEFSFRGWVEKLKSGLRLGVRLGGWWGLGGGGGEGVEFSFF